MLRYLTAGESHGPQLTAIVEGLPAGLPLNAEEINQELARRQCGYGRGGRMKIETDTVEILSGVRWGETLGSPVTLKIRNRDWENWLERMSPEPEHRGSLDPVTRARPGHADLPGALKYHQHDVRSILERSSARETAARVAVGSVARKLLEQFGITIGGYVAEIGGITATVPAAVPLHELKRLVAESELFICDPAAEVAMKELIDRTKAAGDSLGGVVEVVAEGVPVGLGSHVQWDRKLDARLAMAVMSVQAIKGVEIGMGFGTAKHPGSAVHDEIFFDPARREEGSSGFFRRSNNAGGIEGGISNGETIRLRAAMKPIPTLYRPLRTVDIVSKEPMEATVERSDVCAVPAALVVVEAVVATELAGAFMEKFGGDSLTEIVRNYEGFCRQLQEF